MLASRTSLFLALVVLAAPACAGSGSSTELQVRAPRGPDFVGQRPVSPGVGRSLAASDGTTPIEPLDIVNFPTDSAVPFDPAPIQIQKVAAWMRRHPQLRLVLEGHCDRSGTDAYNLDLAQRRTSSVRDELVRRGIASDRMVMVVFGSRDAEDGLHDPASRRVEMYATSLAPSAIASASIDYKKAVAATWTDRGADIEERQGVERPGPAIIASRK